MSYIYNKVYNIVVVMLMITMCMTVTSCHADADVTLHWNGKEVTMSPKTTRGFGVDIKKGNVKINVDGDNDRDITIRLTGNCKEGHLHFKGNNKLTLILDNLNLKNDSGYAIKVSNAKATTIIANDDTENELGDAGINCKGDLTLKGDGKLAINAKNNGHKGIKVDGDLTIEDNILLDITTSGLALKAEEMKAPEGDFPGGMPGPPPGDMKDMPQGPDGKMPQGVNGKMPQGPRDMPQGPNGMPQGPKGMPGQPHGDMKDMPRGPEGMPMPPHGDMEGMPGPPPGGGQPFVRYDYSGSAKGIKVKGNIVINGGTINVKTSTPGAEGIETKKTITISGGNIHVEAYDDGFSVARQMTVTGGTVYVKSSHNDGIDINANNNGSYVQTGGDVTCVSEAGPPEDALDTDWHEISHTGGTLKRIPEGPGPMQ